MKVVVYASQTSIPLPSLKSFRNAIMSSIKNVLMNGLLKQKHYIALYVVKSSKCQKKRNKNLLKDLEDLEVLEGTGTIDD
jgi:hypothetical protein